MKYQAEIQHSIDYLNSPEAFLSIDTNPYWEKWNSPWWHMSLLFEMGLSHLIPKATAQRMLDSSSATYRNYFFEAESPADKLPTQEAPCPCQIGNGYQFLKATGVDVDAKLPWAREWFLRYQMPDGGLNCDESAYKADAKASSMVGTISPLEAILLTSTKLTAAEEKFVDLGAQCLIERELRFGSVSHHNAEERISAQDWTQLCFPRFYFYDVLRGLSFLVKWAELRHKKLPESSIAEVVRLIEQRHPDGLIRVERHSYEGVTTRVLTGESDWSQRAPASHFALMDAVGELGTVSPTLTAKWTEVKETIRKLKERGLLK